MKKRMIGYAAAIALLLIIPVSLTFWSRDSEQSNWNWGLGDVLFAFVIPLGAAFVYELMSMKITRNSHRLLLASLIVAVTCAIWVALATAD